VSDPRSARPQAPQAPGPPSLERGHSGELSREYSGVPTNRVWSRSAAARSGDSRPCLSPGQSSPARVFSPQQRLHPPRRRLSRHALERAMSPAGTSARRPPACASVSESRRQRDAWSSAGDSAVCARPAAGSTSPPWSTGTAPPAALSESLSRSACASPPCASRRPGPVIRAQTARSLPHHLRRLPHRRRRLHHLHRLRLLPHLRHLRLHHLHLLPVAQDRRSAPSSTAPGASTRILPGSPSSTSSQPRARSGSGSTSRGTVSRTRSRAPATPGTSGWSTIA